jgi:hypothetical protein
MPTQREKNSLGHSLPSDREGSPAALSSHPQNQTGNSPAPYLRDNQHPRPYPYHRSAEERYGGWYELQYDDDSEHGGRL